MAPVLTVTARNAMLNALTALLNNGTIAFQTSGDVEVATCGFGATAFASASSGSATANAISDDTDATGGTIEHAKLFTSGAAEVMELSCGTVGSGADIEMTSLVVGAGDTVSVSSLVLTQPAS